MLKALFMHYVMKPAQIGFTLFFILCGHHAALATLPQVTEVVGKDGVTLWAIEDHNLPIITFTLSFKKAGYAYDPEDKQGLANMVASLLNEGAGPYTSQQFLKALEENAIQLSFSTDRDNFTIQCQVLTDKLDQAITLLGLALHQPRFDTDATERVRSQLMDMLLRQQEEPDYRAGRALSRLMFGPHPYSFPEPGTPKTVAAITRQDLAEFTKQRFAKDTLIVSVAGDISPARMRKKMDTLLDPLPAKASFNLTLEEVHFPEKGKLEWIEMDIPQSIIAFAFPAVTRQDPAYYATYTMNHAWGGSGFESRLMKQIREQQGMAYSVYSYLSSSEKAGWLGGSAGTSYTQTEKVSQMVKELAAAASRHGLDPKEIENAREYIILSFPLQLTKNSTLSSLLNTMQRETLGRDYLTRRDTIFRSLTPEAVNHAAATTLDPDRMFMVIVGRKPSL